MNLRDDNTNKNCDSAELLWLTLHKNAINSRLLVGVSYSPPNIKDEEECQFPLRIEIAVKQGNVINMGNFNYPDYNWANGTAY